MSHISNIKTSATLAINELSNKLEKEGKEIYKFGLGQSPFPVPEIIVEELKKRLPVRSNEKIKRLG